MDLSGIKTVWPEDVYLHTNTHIYSAVIQLPSFQVSHSNSLLLTVKAPSRVVPEDESHIRLFLAV